MSDIQIHFDASGFTRELGRWAAHSRKDMGKVIEQQARLVLSNVIRLTPPGKFEGSQLRTHGQAKEAGQRMVEGDLARLFRPVELTSGKKRTAEAAEARANGSAIAAIHRRNRGRNGRVPKRVAKVVVYKGDFNKYRTAQLKKVGSLAAGWKHAVNKLGLKRVPAWIMGHNSPGDCQVIATDRVLVVRMRNAVRYAGDFYGLERRIQIALNLQENNMRRQVDELLAKRKRL